MDVIADRVKQGKLTPHQAQEMLNNPAAAEGAGAAAMNELETQMQGLAQILREGGAGAADMRRAVADVPQAG